MGLNIWLKDDIRNAILAAEEASAATAAILEDMESDPRLLWAYRQGYKAALAVLATALGLDKPEGKRCPAISSGKPLTST